MKLKESASMSYFKNEIASVSFHCKYNTSFGQSLRLVGNIEELGSWNPENSLLLVTDPSIYPIWKSTTEIICPVGMEIIYKYILKSDDGNIIWENLPNNENRKITVSSQGKFIINDEEGIIENNVIKKEEITKRSKSIMELKADLTENFSKKDLFSYDPNEISNINNELYDTFIFSENQKLNSEDRIIIASIFLPFEIVKTGNEDNKYKINLGDENLIYQILFDMKEKHFCDVFWVGMLKNYNEFDEIEIEEIAEFLLEKNIYLVTVTDKEFNDYQMYMSKIITPVFIDSTIDLSNEYFLAYEDYFSAFQTINKKFANMIQNFIQIKDLLMINDIGLCLIPNSLMQKKLYSRVGIYFHMSFPSSDVFKALPKSGALIKSVLLCDVIGFHVFNYARNFLTVLNRDFGIYYEIKHNGFITLNYLGKYIILHIMHAGIDMDSIKKITSSNEYNNYIDKYKRIIGDKISFLSIDNSVELSELKIKFDAYEKFLDTHEEYKGKSILIQILKLTDFDKNNISYIEKYVSHIKEKFGEDSISFQKYDQKENSINIKEEIALYTLCEILLILQKWRGICTSVNQFLLCKNAEKKFGLIISESIGVSLTVKSPIRVNPFNKNELVSAIEKILNRPDDIKNDYYEKDMYYIKRNTTFSWIKAFFSDLKRVTIDNEKFERVELGIGFDFRLMKLSRDFKHLNLNNLTALYKKSKKRLFFIDYEETLQTFEEMDTTKIDLSDKVILETHSPNERIISVLQNLCSDLKNEIYIITGRKKKFLKSWFGNIKNLGLGAEYGFFYKQPESKKNNNNNYDEDGFCQLINVKDWSWKDAALNILKEFTEKTEGSKLTLKESSISWSYKNSDSYFGHIQANEVSVHLLNFFGETKLDVVTGKDYVEIKPKNINKGFFISQILLKNLENNDCPDFIFSIGDDTSDEEMFKFLNYVNREQYRVNENIKIFTVTMGKKPSVANYYITEPGELVEYLEMLYHHN